MINCELVYLVPGKAFSVEKRVLLGQMLKFDELSLTDKVKEVLEEKVASGEKIKSAFIECKIEVPEDYFRREEILGQKLP